ncbi:MAG TPA: polysaccharide biosynthesis/export family protein [Pirellulales bacterium]|jgi:protein involved in polysaccharide export with SLBB domain|nr:polysaccharide biosynthesis/export family protein [Pirellulales bacterium]
MDEQTLNQQGRWTAIALLTACLACSGCATMMKGAIPASQLPPELMAPAHCPRTPIDFTLLRQPPPPSYLVGPRDILGIYIQDVLGRNDEPPPVFALLHTPNSSDPPLAVGNPVTVADDGTIILPRIPPMRVAGMTIPQIDAAIRRAYTLDTRILQPGQEVVTVTLIRKRLHRIMVIREDSSAVPPILKPRDGTLIARRGTTTAIELPSFENDVLHALSQTGGLPGEDARNEIWVLRGAANGGLPVLEQLQNGMDPATLPTSGASAIVRIPLSVVPGAALPFGPSDVVLSDGDVLFVQSRMGDCFYTGGLLPGGQFMLPRDYDLDIINAISLAGGAPHGPAGFPLIAQLRSGSGPGNVVSPTRCLVIRKTPTGGQIKIYIDLRKALNDPREQVLVQSGDTIYLFWKPWEILANIGLNLVNVQYSIP